MNLTEKPKTIDLLDYSLAKKTHHAVYSMLKCKNTRLQGGSLGGRKRDKKTMLNHPNQNTQSPQADKLILPAPPEQMHQAYPQTTPVWADQSVHSPMPLESTQYIYPQSSPVPPPDPTQYTHPQYSPLPHNPMTRRRGVWRKDPAYLVLSFAIALVVVAALVLVTFGATTILNNNGFAYSQTPTAPTPSGTVDNNPNFGTPATGLGSNQSSQPPVVPTPNLNPQPSPNPTNQPEQGSLSVQIANIPSVVSNNSKVSVSIQTSEPGVQVKLQVTYNAAPFFFNSRTRTTDDNGQATLSWNVRVFSLRSNSIQATVQVIATDQNGQQVSSQAVIVMVEG